MRTNQNFKAGEIVECILPQGDLIYHRKYKIYRINDENNIDSLIDVIDLVSNQLVTGWYSSRFRRTKKIIRKII
jgi:hypothetical protein